MMTTHYRCAHLCGILIVHIKYSFLCFLLGNSPASEFFMPTFRYTLSHLHRLVGMNLDWIWEKLEYLSVASMWVVTLHSLFLYSEPPLPCHPPSYWLRLFSNQTFSRINTLHEAHFQNNKKCKLRDAVESSLKLHESCFIGLALTKWKWFISSHKLVDAYGVHRENNNSYCQYLLKNVESPVYEGHIKCARINSGTFAFGLQNGVCCMTTR